jgi:hydrogenase maturation protein HypF
MPLRGDTAFAIAASSARGPRATLISPDTATCAECLAELRAPTDRRYRHPFITCTNCGPRFTIVTGVPYDRVATTMAGFPMCAACAAEYHDPTDRRFHAQPVCCPDCGPTLRLVDAGGHDLPGDPTTGAARMLVDGAVLAVKGLGGYHLAALAGHEQAVAELRARKHREDKPFAVMAPGLVTASTDRAAAQAPWCAACRRRRPRQRPHRAHAALHARAPPAARRPRRSDRADQRQRLRRTDRPPR